MWIKYCFVFCRKLWKPCKDTTWQRKRGICRLRYSYLKWPAISHMPSALWGDRGPYLGLPPSRIYFLWYKPAHGVIYLTMVKANTAKSMQKCRCEFCVQAERFWWKPGISAPNVSKKKCNRELGASYLFHKKNTEKSFRSAHIAPYNHTTAHTEYMHLPNHWLNWQQYFNFLNPALCLNYRAVLSLHSHWMLKYPTANVRLTQSSGLPQLSAPELTPGLTWYFKRWKLQNVSVRDLKAVSYFQLGCSLTFSRL